MKLNILLRFGICALVLIFYLVALRPFRIYVTEQWVYPQIEKLSENASLYNAQLKGGSIHIRYNFMDKDKELQYRPRFGFFFLISILALIIVRSKKEGFFLLFILHLAATLISFPLLVAGVIKIPVGFIFLDIISGYLTPAFSLALVPVVAPNRNTIELLQLKD